MKTLGKLWRSIGSAGLWPATVALAALASLALGPLSGQAGAPAGGQVVYLPAVVKNIPLPNVYGVTMSPVGNSGGLGLVQATSSAWVRGPYLDWSSAETTPGARDWSHAPTGEMLAAAQNNLSLILAVSQTPAWAQKVPGYSCGPMGASHIAQFAAFMHDAVARYSVPPYNVKYWEIWNEPDIAPSEAPTPNSPFGCWGNTSDYYYGGEYYGQVLAQVSAQMKAANPSVTVLVGGLLLNCNPNNPPPGNNCWPAHFLEGVLRGGGANAFDGVSVHAYDYYANSLGLYANPGWQASSNTIGPGMRPKATFVRGVLNDYGAGGKLLLNTESALLCDNNCTSDFEKTKAYYLAESFASALADGMAANVWYSLAGWRNSGLVDGGGNPVMAYDAYQFGSQQLLGATFRTAINSYSNVVGFEFTNGPRRIWVLWATVPSVIVALPGMPAAIYDVDGTALAPAANITLTREPLYIIW